MKNLVLFILLGFILSVNAQTQIMYDTGEITAVDPYTTTYDAFGDNVAIDGDYAIIGAVYNKNGGTQEKGAAYIYHWNGTAWVQQQKLVAYDAAYGDNYGCSVDISGNYAIVGASGDDREVDSNDVYDCGSAYVWERNGTSWYLDDHIYPDTPDVQENSNFGHRVAIDGDYVVVSAPQYDITGYDNKGAAFIFLRNGSYWNYQQAKLTATDAYNLGSDVAIDGDYVLVGCSNKAYFYSFGIVPPAKQN